MEQIVILKTPELRQSVKNKSHAVARALESNGKLNYEAASEVQLSDDSGNYEMCRAITSAITDAKIVLWEYLDETHSTYNNLIPSVVEAEEDTSGSGTPTDEVRIVLQLPENFNTASPEAIVTGIHDYVVYRSIYSWYRLTVPELAKACKEDAMDAMGRVMSALEKRVRPTRPE